MSEWRVIARWPDYEVSSTGQVRRGTHLMGQYWAGPYLRVYLRRDGRRTPVRVHKLVTEAFLGPCPEGLQVRHLNDDKTDNRVENLAYGTSKENANDAMRNGCRPRLAACKYGHPLSGDNLRIRLSGTRRCMACQRRWDRESDERKRHRRMAARQEEEE